MAIEFEAGVSPYQYIGDEYTFGSLQLTMLARSFEQLAVTSLQEFFPSRLINERTIVVEQIIEGVGIMPIVRFGIPSGGYLEQNRVRSMTARPAVVREDDFIEQHFINQVRRVGTFNEAYRPEEFIQRRVQQLVARHSRTKDLFITKALLGGIKYTDPRTGVSIDVSSNIPAHNLFKYDGFNATVSDGTINVGGSGLKANKALTNSKGRPEALMFKSTDARCAVPWTDNKADIIYCLRLIKEYLYKTNKNRPTDILISSDLLTILMENEYIKALSNVPGVVILNQPTSTVAGNANIAATANTPASYITMGAGGEISSIAGLRIIAVDGLYRDPVDNVIKTYWPAHKVAIVSRSASGDPSATLGFTYHCSGEAPDGQPGMYMRTSAMSEPPAPPGRVMQLGDAFLPVVIYPHWISILDVCEPNELSNKFIIQSNLSYGTF